MIQFLQIAVSVIFFANKVFVLIGKKFGWLLGTIAAGLACWYFFLLNLYVYTILEIGLLILMGYGFIKKDKTNLYTERFIRLTLMICMAIIAIFTFNGHIAVFEFISAILMLYGTYLLTHHSEKNGWILYSIAHIFACYIGFAKQQNMFADLQLASGIVSFAGAIQSYKSKV